MRFQFFVAGARGHRMKLNILRITGNALISQQRHYAICRSSTEDNVCSFRKDCIQIKDRAERLAHFVKLGKDVCLSLQRFQHSVARGAGVSLGAQHRRHDVIGRYQQLCVAQRLVIVTHIGGAFFRCLFEAQSAGADGNAVAILELLFQPRIAIDVNLVSAAAKLAVNQHAIDESECGFVFRADVRVIARDTWIVQHDTIVRGAANGAGNLRRQLVLPLTSASVYDFDQSHDWFLIPVENCSAICPIFGSLFSVLDRMLSAGTRRDPSSVQRR